MPRDSNSRGFGPASLLGVAFIVLVSAIAMLAPQKADALPSFARQTGGKNNAPKLWPWFNSRLGLQYIAYNKFNGAKYDFDGMGTNARDNNTVLVYLWSTF